jgi:secreted trypsin-like serine protease
MTQVKQMVENGRPIKKSIIHSVPGKTESEFFAGGRNLPDTCKGDSGGPAFIKDQDGRLLLAGITSRGAVGCDQGGVYTLVPAFLPWINGVTGLY